MASNLGQSEENLETIKKEIAAHPDDDKLYNRLGNYYFQVEKNFREAINQYKIAIQKNPNNHIYYINIGDSFYQLNDPNEAISWYSRALDQHPEDDIILNTLGNTYATMRMYEDAIVSYKDAIRIKPTPAYYVNLGDIYSQQGLYDRAIAQYKGALFIDERCDFAYAALGDIHEKLFKSRPSETHLWEQAINNYKSAVQFNPRNGLYSSRMGDLYFLKSDYDHAIECYKKATDLDPKDAFSFANMGYSYFYKKDYGKALQYYNIAEKINRESVLKYKGDYHKGMREYDKAVLYYNEILSNDKFQTPTDIIISLTEIYTSDDPSIRNFGKAEELAKLAIQKDPENFLAHDALGRVYENENEYDEALKNYKKAVSLYDKDEFLYLSIGRIYSKQSDFPAAEQSFNKALEINRNSSNAFEWLAHIYSKARKWDQAVKFQKSAKEAAERQNLPSDTYDKGLALIYHDKGLDLYNEGNFQDAIEEYNKANSLSESDVTYRNISLCYFYLGEYPKALTAIEKAIRLIPPDDPKYSELKMQYEKELQDIKTKIQ